MIAAPATMGPTGFLKDNIAGALAYITFIPAIVFLLKKPFKANPFIRFHSWQSIFLAIAAVVVGLVLRIVFSFLGFIPHIGYLVAWLIGMVTFVGWWILWLVALIKAFQGEFFRLPIVGHFAEKV